VFNAGLSSLNIPFAAPAQQQQQTSSSSSSVEQQQDDLDNNPKYQAFIKQLSDMGYFNNCDEEQKKQRIEKAKEKFLVRSKTTTSSAASASASVEVDSVTAEKYKTEGNDHLKQKQYKSAIESYKKAIQADPTNAIYPANMGAAYMQMNDFESAEQCCKKAIEIDPKYGKARSRLALIYQRKGKNKDAIAQLEEALKHDPNNEEYKNKLTELRNLSSPASSPAAASNPFAAMMGGGGGNPLAAMMGGGGGNPFGGLASMMGGGGGGMPDFGAMLSNPEFMRTAMDLMQRPEMQSMVQNMMGGFMPGGNDQGAGENPLGLDDAALEKVLEDPEVQNNPKLKQIFEECREKGLNHSLQYLSDPDVVNFMTGFVQRRLGNPNNMEDEN